MTEKVSFILVAESSAAIAQVRRRLDSLPGLEKEYFSLITELSENGALISPGHGADFDKFIRRAKGDYIQVVFSNQIFDTETFKSELNLLSANTRASCLVRCDQSLKLDCDRETGGSVFVFQCFHQLVFPVASIAQILVRRSSFAFNINLNFQRLTALDWLFQIARLGPVIVVRKKRYSSISLSANVRSFVSMTKKYRSFLHSVGYTYEIIMEKIAEQLILEASGSRNLSARQQLEKIISAERMQKTDSKLLSNDDYLVDLRTAGLAVIASGAATLRKRKRGSEIAVREKELQMLLSSLPWRLTSWLRSCKKIVRPGSISLKTELGSAGMTKAKSHSLALSSPDCIFTTFDSVDRGSKTVHFDADAENYHVEYQKYLDGEIESILQSRSWRLAGLLKLHKNEIKSRQALRK